MASVPTPVRFFRRGKDFGIGDDLGDQPHAEGAGRVEGMPKEDDLSRAKVAIRGVHQRHAVLLS